MEVCSRQPNPIWLFYLYIAVQIDMFYEDGPNMTTPLTISNITYSNITGNAEFVGT